MLTLKKEAFLGSWNADPKVRAHLAGIPFAQYIPECHTYISRSVDEELSLAQTIIR